MTLTIHKPLTTRPPTLAPEIDQNPLGLRVAVCKVGEVVNVRENRWDLSGNPPNLTATTIYWVSGQTYTGENYKTKNYGPSNQFRAVWLKIKESEPLKWHYVADLLLDVSGPVPADMNNPFDSGSDEICVIRRAEGAPTIIKAYDEKSTGADVTHTITDNTPYWASCNDWTTTNWTALFHDGQWHFIKGESLDRAEVKPTLWSDLIDSSQQPPGSSGSPGAPQGGDVSIPAGPVPELGPDGEDYTDKLVITCNVADDEELVVHKDKFTNVVIGKALLKGETRWAADYGGTNETWLRVYHKNGGGDYDWYYVRRAFVKPSKPKKKVGL